MAATDDRAFLGGSTPQNMHQPTKHRVISHTIKTASGKSKVFQRYTRKFAIAAMCTECLGFAADPKACTAPACPLIRTAPRPERPCANNHQTMLTIG